MAIAIRPEKSLSPEDSRIMGGAVDDLSSFCERIGITMASFKLHNLSQNASGTFNIKNAVDPAGLPAKALVTYTEGVMTVEPAGTQLSIPLMALTSRLLQISDLTTLTLNIMSELSYHTRPPKNITLVMGTGILRDRSEFEVAPPPVVPGNKEP